MVYRTIIRIKVMYSTASPPPKKEGAKSITPSGIKGGENRQPYGNACLYSTRSFQWAQQQNRKAAGFPAAFCVERRRFGEDISNPCRRHTETLHYSLFTLHLPQLRRGKQPMRFGDGAAEVQHMTGAMGRTCLLYTSPFTTEGVMLFCPFEQRGWILWST